MTAFTSQPVPLSEEERIYHRLITFHRERVELIRADKAQPALTNASRLVVHLIPKQALLSRKEFTATELKNAASKMKSLGMSMHTYGHSRFNADGELFSNGEKTVRSYAQLYRSGIFEGVMCDAIYLQNEHTKVLRDNWCEEAMMTALFNYLGFVKAIKVDLPVWIIAAICGCSGAKICRDPSCASHTENGIDRDIVWLPETIVESFDANPEKLLRPVFDVMFNAAGLERSFHYDENGKRQKVR